MTEWLARLSAFWRLAEVEGVACTCAGPPHGRCALGAWWKARGFTPETMRPTLADHEGAALVVQRSRLVPGVRMEDALAPRGDEGEENAKRDP
jgi:hypothetical protein